VTARIQQQRFTTPGERPAPSLLRPGSLFVNLADRYLGVADAAGDPQPLLGVQVFSPAALYPAGAIVAHEGVLYRALQETGPGAFSAAHWRTPDAGNVAAGLTPPANPQVNDLWLDRNAATAELKVWNGVEWARANPVFLPLAGGALTGALDIAGQLGALGGIRLALDRLIRHDAGALVLEAPGQQVRIGGTARLELANTGTTAGLRLAAGAKEALLDLLADDSVRITGIGRVWDLLSDGTLVLPVETTNANGAVRKGYVDAKIAADIAAAIAALADPLTQGEGDARYLQLSGGALSGLLRLGTAVSGVYLRLGAEASSFSLASDIEGTGYRGLNLGDGWVGATGTAGATLARLNNGANYLQLDRSGNFTFIGDNTEGAQLFLGRASDGKGGYFDVVPQNNALRIFHDMGRAVGNHIIWSFIGDGTFQLPTQTAQATGAARKDYVDGLISATSTALTAQINARLTQAQANALYTTPAFVATNYYNAAQTAVLYQPNTVALAPYNATDVDNAWRQNATGRLLTVTLYAKNASAGSPIEVYLSSTASGGYLLGTSTDYLSLTFLVPIGWYYLINTGVFNATGTVLEVY
jgi:hypothetical protein